MVFFNHTRLKIQTQDRSYDQGIFLHNHTCIVLMLGLLVDDVLSSMKPELRRVQTNMDRTQRKEKEVDNKQDVLPLLVFVALTKLRITS